MPRNKTVQPVPLREASTAVVHKPLPTIRRACTSAARRPMSTTSASRRARCISRSAWPTRRSGTLRGLDLCRRARRPGRRRRADRRRHSRARTTSRRSFADEPLFADKEILFHGQALFAVVATTRDAARRAARLAKIDIEEDEAGDHRRRRARRPARACCRITHSAAATLQRALDARAAPARRRACASAARSISISKARPRSPCPAKRAR